MELFDENKCALCCFLGDQYHYKRRDWYSGSTWDVSLSESMKYEDDLKINQMKEKKNKTTF